ncbi:hypothetical protein TNCV_1227971 [Trichonephila clavipes]|nr:hypothetical protein TNCV_1227971 [Trichonephila clavipes]
MGIPLSPRNQSNSRWNGDTNPFPLRLMPNKRFQSARLWYSVLGPAWCFAGGLYATYCASLRKLRRALQNKQRGMLSKGILLLHDNAMPHTSRMTRELIESLG